MADARVDTGFIERHAQDLIPGAEPPDAVLEAAAFSLLPAPTGDPWTSLPGFRLNGSPETQVDLEIGGKPYWAKAMAHGAVTISEGVAYHSGEAWPFGPRRAHGGGNASEGDGTILSPMPGSVVAVHVSEGQKVAKGQTLLVLEAMKMELALVAPFAGVVREMKVAANAQVPEGTLLARIEAEEN